MHSGSNNMLKMTYCILQIDTDFLNCITGMNFDFMPVTTVNSNNHKL